MTGESTATPCHFPRRPGADPSIDLAFTFYALSSVVPEATLRTFWLHPALLLAALPACVSAHDRELIRTLDREVIALKMENERLLEQSQTCESRESPPPTLYFELNQVFADGPVKLTRDGDALTLVVPGSLIFAPNTIRVRAESEQVLDLLATALQLHQEYQVLVLVHTAEEQVPSALRKTYPTNWEYSSARATAVVRELTERYGVSPHRFTAAGHSSWAPVADNSTPEGREANHRVEFRLVPQEQP